MTTIPGSPVEGLIVLIHPLGAVVAGAPTGKVVVVPGPTVLLIAAAPSEAPLTAATAAPATLPAAVLHLVWLEARLKETSAQAREARGPSKPTTVSTYTEPSVLTGMLPSTPPTRAEAGVVTAAARRPAAVEKPPVQLKLQYC